jgi:membrane-bound serine protease (ClpP class)
MPSPAGVVGTSAILPAGIGGVVRKAIEPLGSVYVAGEEWSARTADGRSVERGTPVRVISTDGLTVIVEPDTSSSSQ